MNAANIFQISKSVLDILKVDETLVSVILDKDKAKEVFNEVHQKYECFKEYFESPMGDACEADVKKAVAAAIIMARDKGVLPADFSETDAEHIAVIVDKGLNNAKLAYKVAVGDTNAIDAVDKMIDNAATRTAALVDIAFEKGLVKKGVEVAANAICNWLEVPAAPVIAVVDSVFDRVEPQIKEMAHKGVKFLATKAKEMVRKIAPAIEKIESTVRSFASTVKDLLFA